MTFATAYPWVKLQDIVSETQYGTSQLANENGGRFPILRMNNITYDGAFSLDDLKWIDLAERDFEKHTVRRGDLLFNRTNSRELVGKTAVWNRDDRYAFAGYLIRVRFDESRVFSGYVSAYLNSSHGKSMLFARAKPSINMSNISASDLLRIEIPLPPLSAQKRIAAILDQADAIRRKRRHVQAEVAGLRLSTFYELFGSPFANNHGWIQARIDECGAVQGGITLGTRRSGYSLQMPYLRVANVYRDRLDLSEVKTIGVTEAEAQRTKLEPGDVLVVEGHGNPDEIGRCAVWDGSISPCLHQNHLIKVHPNMSKVTPNYLSTFLNSPEGRRQLIRAGKTTSGLNTISLSNVRATIVELPPLPIQKQYEETLQQSSRIGQASQQACIGAGDLFDSLVQRAFRGEF